MADDSNATWGASTNGITEYTASVFGGQLDGDLLLAGFDGTIARVKLDATGTSAVLDTTLFSAVGSSAGPPSVRR